MVFVNRRFTADFHEQAAQAREMEAYVCCRRHSVRVIVQNDDTRLEREALGMASHIDSWSAPSARTPGSHNCTPIPKPIP